MSSGNRPVHEIKLGRIRASIWTHEGNGQGTMVQRLDLAALPRAGGVEDIRFIRA